MRGILCAASSLARSMSRLVIRARTRGHRRPWRLRHLAIVYGLMLLCLTRALRLRLPMLDHAMGRLCRCGVAVMLA